MKSSIAYPIAAPFATGAGTIVAIGLSVAVVVAASSSRGGSRLATVDH